MTYFWQIVLSKSVYDDIKRLIESYFHCEVSNLLFLRILNLR